MGQPGRTCDAGLAARHVEEVLSIPEKRREPSGASATLFYIYYLYDTAFTKSQMCYAVTLIPTFIMWDAVGGLNTFAPLTVPAWFGGAAGGVFNVFLLRQFFLTIPFELDEAAYIDGVSPWRVFWQIVMPLSRPAVVVVTIFTFIQVWNDFLGPLVYLNDERLYTLAVGLASFQSVCSAQWGYLMAASAAVIAPIIVLFFFAQRYFIEGVTLTGLKSFRLRSWRVGCGGGAGRLRRGAWAGTARRGRTLVDRWGVV